MELKVFKDLFSSLSHLTQLSFELWDAEGLLLSSAVGKTKSSSLTKAIQDVSAQVLSEGVLIPGTLQGKYHVFGAPIKKGEEIFGALIVYGTNFVKMLPARRVNARRPVKLKEVERFIQSMVFFIEDRLSSQQESEKLAEELSQSFEDLYLYAKIGSQVKTLRFSYSTLTDLTRELLDTMRSDMAFVQLVNPKEYTAIHLAEGYAGKIAEPKAFVKSLIDSIPPSSPSLKENYFLINDSHSNKEFCDLRPVPYRFLVVTIQFSDNFYGWLGLISYNLKELFRRGELKLLVSIAEQIAVNISNSQLYRDLENFVINMVKSLVNAIEAKDLYTRGHSERVHLYSKLMADYLGLDEEKKNVLNWAAILHDIGKIGIAENILNKPNPLSEAEYEIVKDHPSKGFNILQPLEPLGESLAGILHHHERYDGQGYPKGLKGKEIPLLARIIAVADTFDAISSNRAYRFARPSEEALGIIEKAAGRQLDPELVDVFVKSFNKYLASEKEGANPWMMPQAKLI